MPTPLDPYVRLQMTLECIGLDEQGAMIRIPGPHPDGIPRVARYRCTSGATHLVIRADVDSVLREHLRTLGPDHAIERYADVLGDPGLIGRFATSTFETPGSTGFPDVHREDDRLVIRAGDQLLATAQSSRENDDAAELWVVTAAEARRAGLGQQVAAAWAAAILMEGKVPFYSHALDNIASAALARALGVVPRFAMDSVA